MGCRAWLLLTVKESARGVGRLLTSDLSRITERAVDEDSGHLFRLVVRFTVILNVADQVVEDELGELIELFLGHFVYWLLRLKELLFGLLSGHVVSLMLLETPRAPLVLRSWRRIPLAGGTVAWLLGCRHLY